MSEKEKAPSEIAKRLRWARENAGLSQGQAARLLGWHRPTISQIESGDREIKADEIGLFAKLYDVRDEWLLKGDTALLGKKDPRIEIAARELGKLKQKDFETVLQLIQVMRAEKGGTA